MSKYKILHCTLHKSYPIEQNQGELQMLVLAKLQGESL